MQERGGDLALGEAREDTRDDEGQDMHDTRDAEVHVGEEQIRIDSHQA